MSGFDEIAAIFREVGPMWRRLAHGILGDWALADDCVQETMIKLARSPAFELADDKVAYATRSVRNMANRMRRRLGREVPTEDSMLIYAGAATIDDVAARATWNIGGTCWQTCLAELTARERKAIQLDAEGRSLIELAEELGCSVAAANGLLYRARRKHHDCVRKCEASG